MSKKYTFEDIRNYNLLIYSYIRGSHAYGLQKPDGSSDTDTAGVFIEPNEWLLGLGLDYQEQIQDEKGDNVWYSLKKFMNMLLSSNPTVLESLFVPEKCILYEHPIMTEIKKHRDRFVTKACFEHFIGYAYTQIKKREVYINYLLILLQKGKNRLISYIHSTTKEAATSRIGWNIVD